MRLGHTLDRALPTKPRILFTPELRTRFAVPSAKENYTFPGSIKRQSR